MSIREHGSVEPAAGQSVGLLSGGTTVRGGHYWQADNGLVLCLSPRKKVSRLRR